MSNGLGWEMCWHLILSNVLIPSYFKKNFWGSILFEYPMKLIEFVS